MIYAVIGGGASGMLAAISCAHAHPSDTVLLFERQTRVGRKLLSTGNGRCNLSNEDISRSHYHGQSPDFVNYAIKTVDPLGWFHEKGLFTVTEKSGRIYPLSDSANSVLDILRFSLEKDNIHVHLGCEVRSIKKLNNQFSINTDSESFSADRVIVACGGLAGTKLGGSMSGYQLLRSFGHSCAKLFPALVQLKTEEAFVNPLKGVRCDAGIALYDKEVIAQSDGEIQFTQYGISGPAIFEISRQAAVHHGQLTLVLDFLRSYDKKDVLKALEQKCKTFPELKSGELLTGIVHNRLGKMLLKSSQVSLDMRCCELSTDDLCRVAEACKHFLLPVTGTMGMDCAQVTAGGVITDEFDAKTLQSKLCKGLYACGEVLDIDGDCGGYNLHWAWASGYLAGLLKEE